MQVAHPRHAVDDGGSGQVARVEVAVELAPARARFRTHYELGNDELLSSWPGGRRFEPQMGNASFGRATASKKPQEPRSCHLWHEHTFPTWKGEARQEPRRALDTRLRRLGSDDRAVPAQTDLSVEFL